MTSSPFHDAIVSAFTRIPGVTHFSCEHYTHIHGPNQECNKGAGDCRNHFALVERWNGTVAPFQSVAKEMGARRRPDVPISEDPLGYAGGPKFGKFDHAFDVETILRDWGSFDAFAGAVVTMVKRVEPRTRW